jgi:hypothetical protein
MAPKKTLKIHISSQSAAKLVGLVSNTVLLASNTYLIVSGLQEEMRSRRRQRLTGGFQVAVEVAGALAALTKVISETLEQHHGQRT